MMFKLDRVTGAEPAEEFGTPLVGVDDGGDGVGDGFVSWLSVDYEAVVKDLEGDIAHSEVFRPSAWGFAGFKTLLGSFEAGYDVAGGGRFVVGVGDAGDDFEVEGAREGFGVVFGFFEGPLVGGLEFFDEDEGICGADEGDGAGGGTGGFGGVVDEDDGGTGIGDGLGGLDVGHHLGGIVDVTGAEGSEDGIDDDGGGG